MALEAELYYELELPVPMTCADGAGIEKGAFLELNDDATVTTSNGDSDKVVGIAANEKIASDGVVKVGVYLRGVFLGYAGTDGVTVGRAIRMDSTAAANELSVASANEEGIVGTAWATASDGQRFKFLLNCINPVLA
jgi:predicted RecA/RadA family phage recombinase